jgi:hypothetical protein
LRREEEKEKLSISIAETASSGGMEKAEWSEADLVGSREA